MKHVLKSILDSMKKLSLICSIGMIVLIGTINFGMGAILYVPDQYSTIETAIDAANFGDTVMVKSGTYHENIQMKDGVIISGSGESSTIIEGDGSDPVVLAPAGVTSTAKIEGFTITKGGHGILTYGSPIISNNTITDNAKSGIHVAGSEGDPLGIKPTITDNKMTFSKESGILILYAAPIIINNTITNNTDPYNGGGIHVEHSAAWISNNVISQNKTLMEGHGGGGISALWDKSTIASNIITGNFTGPISTARGGGVRLHQCAVIVSNNIISENWANWDGGGIAIEYESLDGGRTLISGNRITGNIAKNWFGGGISAQSGNVTITNNHIEGNSAGGGGGIHCEPFAPGAIITRNVIMNNYAGDGGGAYLFSHNAAHIYTFSENEVVANEGTSMACGMLVGGWGTVAKNIIRMNNGSCGGGGITTWVGAPIIDGNLITDNSGSIGGINSYGNASSLIINNIIARNQGDIGGVFLPSHYDEHGYGQDMLVNNTITGNIGAGLGMPSDVQPLRYTVANNIIWGNVGLDVDAQVEFPVTTYCLIGTTNNSNPGEGDISRNPKFVDAANGDYHLLSDSPCIDSGGNEFVPISQTMDFEGDPRIIDGNGDSVVKVDIGADEFETIPVTIDIEPAIVWIGLKNSDDQGTQFDLRVELYINEKVMAEGETFCITGVTRNPAYAKEVTVPFGAVSDGDYNPGDVLSLKILTRIGTTPDGQKCIGPGGSHNNAVGLRLYYDAPTRPSRFGAEIFPDPMKDYFLHSSSSDYFLDDVLPTGKAKYKDSSSIDYKYGNPWKEIGTWHMALP